MLSPLSFSARKTAAMEAEIRRLQTQVIELRVEVSRLEVTNQHQSELLAEASTGVETVRPRVACASTSVQTIDTTSNIQLVPVISPPCAVSDASTGTEDLLKSTKDQETQANFELKYVTSENDQSTSLSDVSFESATDESPLKEVTREPPALSTKTEITVPPTFANSETSINNENDIENEIEKHTLVSATTENISMSIENSSSDALGPFESSGKTSDPDNHDAGVTVRDAPQALQEPLAVTNGVPHELNETFNATMLSPETHAHNTWSDYKQGDYNYDESEVNGDVSSENFWSEENIVDENQPPPTVGAVSRLHSTYALAGSGRSPLDDLPREVLQGLLYEYWKDYQKEAGVAGGDLAENSVGRRNLQNSTGCNIENKVMLEGPGKNYGMHDDSAPTDASPEEEAAEEFIDELRTDPTDGYAYTKAQFVEHYGRSDEWDAAVPWLESNC